MINEPVIVEFTSGEVFGGYVDDYESGVFWLYDCKRLSKKDHEWRNHGFMIKIDRKKIEDSMPGFYVNAIRNLLTVKSEYGDEVSVGDALQFYIDPHHKPLRGIDCQWGYRKNHGAMCDAKLHEALSFVLTEARTNGDREMERKIRESWAYVRRRLIMYGAKIP